MKSPLLRIPLMLCLIGLPSLASARGIEWGSEISFVSTLFDSNGNALDSSYRFEIGIFDNSFVATGSNLDQWEANWLIFDRAEAPASTGGWNPALSYFTSSETHDGVGKSSWYADPNQSPVFAQGSQAYLWVYNSKAIDSTSEWALVTDINLIGNTGDQWVFPAISSTTTNLPLTWSLSDADEAVYGKVNGAVGDGGSTVTPGSYSLQTHAVPEPGGALMIGVAGFLFLLRKRKRA